jgi:hypothetical protein
VEPPPIIEHFNIAGNIVFRFVPGWIDGAVHPLIFEGREKEFGQRIIVTAPGATRDCRICSTASFALNSVEVYCVPRSE